MADAKQIVEKVDQQADKPLAGWRARINQARTIVPTSWRHYRARIFEGYLVMAVIIFAVLALLAHTVAYFTFDLQFTKWVQEFHGDEIDALMRFLTWLGFTPQAPMIVLFVILFLYISGLKWEAVAVLFADLSVGLLGTTIKLLVVRPRPDPNLVNVISKLPDYGFPSGHVLFFVTFFGFLGFLAYTLLKPSRLRLVLILIPGILISLIGFSRIYFGQHWASDVIGAYLLGSVWLTVCVRVYLWGKTRFFVAQPVAKETPKAAAG